MKKTYRRHAGSQRRKQTNEQHKEMQEEKRRSETIFPNHRACGKYGAEENERG
jgi:hypothetical protein